MMAGKSYNVIFVLIQSTVVEEIMLQNMTYYMFLLYFFFSYVYKLSDFGTAKPLKDGDFFQSLVGTEEYLVNIYSSVDVDYLYMPCKLSLC